MKEDKISIHYFSFFLHVNHKHLHSIPTPAATAMNYKLDSAQFFLRSSAVFRLLRQKGQRDVYEFKLEAEVDFG